MLLLEGCGGADDTHPHPFSFLCEGLAISYPGLGESGYRAVGSMLSTGETGSPETNEPAVEWPWEGRQGRRTLQVQGRERPKALPRRCGEIKVIV